MIKMGIPKLAQKYMAPDSRYDSARADFAVAFIESLRHTKGEWYGRPFVLLPWQRELIQTVFGVIRPDGHRQFRSCYVEIAKKNGKTALAAAVALLLLVADDEPGAEIYSCAADRAQAALVYRDAASMVGQSPALAKRLKILESTKRIIYPAADSFYQVLSSEAYSKHGLNPHAVLFDETHVADREMFRVMTHGASDARRQPLHLFITTAGNSTTSVGYELHQKALDIRDGRKADQSFLPIIYAADEVDDWTDPQVWAKANPSINVTVPEEKLRAAFESARQNPAEENSFRQLRMCQWVKQSVRWMPMEKWDKCNWPADPDELRGRVCYGGLDLSTTTDVSAFVLVFPPTEPDGKYEVLPYFWIPGDNIDMRVRRDHVQYDLWARQGYLNATEGTVVHYGHIERQIANLSEQFHIREIAFDRWGATQMSQNLEAAGFTVVPFGQGFKDMSPPTKELMRLTLEGKIAHGGHPVLRWMMDNVHVRTDPAGNLKPDKEKSTERIDGVVAAVMALDRAIRVGAEPEQTESIYERGLLVL